MSETARPHDAGAGGAQAAAPGRRSDEHLAAVEAMLDRELDSLQQHWTAASGGQGTGPDPIAYVRRMLRGGKRIRPVMVLLGSVAADVEGRAVETGTGHDDVVRAAAAVELLHCFALIHDDVMDESDLRRGHATVHAEAGRWHEQQGGRGSRERFGDSVAVLVGDLVHAEASRLAAGLPPPMQEVWRQLVLELVDGQLRDLVGSATADRDLAAARLVARQKTGNYSVARPLQLGAVAVGGSAAAMDALETYGRHLGEAFALRDDLLGVYGDPDETGKPVGDDLRAGKPTVLLALAADRLRGGAAEALRAAGSAQLTDARLALIREAMRLDGVVEAVERLIDEQVAAALAALRAGAGSGALSIDGVGQLTSIARTLARREH